MTVLRQKMIEALQLKVLSESAQEAYVRAIRQLAERFHKSPDLISEEDLRQYFLHIKNVKNYSPSGITIALCGIKFFFERTRNKELPILDFLHALLTILVTELSPIQVRD
jgi:integrase/recombinase XerD